MKDEKAKHASEPWFLDESCSDLDIFAHDPKYGEVQICRVDGCSGLDPGDPNARRIVACVNACEGINPEAVPDLRAACKEAEAVVSDYQVWHDDGSRCEDIETATRNTLRAALAKAEEAP